jgi:hypothetical protein
VTLVKTLLVLLAALGGITGFTAVCWLVVETLMRLAGRDPSA